MLTAVPPDAGTRVRPLTCSGVNRMTPDELHEPPRTLIVAGLST